MIKTLTRADAFAEAVTLPPAGESAETGHDVIQTALVGQAPITDLAVTPDGQRMVVGHFGDDGVSLFDTQAARVTATVAGRGEPIAVAATDQRVFVARSAPSYDSVSVIDAETGESVADHPIALNVRSIAVSRNGRRVYVGRTGDAGADVAVLDAMTGDVRVIDLQDGPGSSVDVVRPSRNGRRLYAASSTAYDGYLAVIDVRRGRVGRRIEIGAPIRDVAITDSGVGYVLSCEPEIGGVLHIINTARDTVTATIELGGFPSQLVLSADAERAYLVDRDMVAVMCLRSTEIVDTMHIAAEPSCVAVHPDGTSLYVADYAGRLSVMSTAAVETYDDELEAVAV